MVKRIISRTCYAQEYIPTVIQLLLSIGKNLFESQYITWYVITRFGHYVKLTLKLNFLQNSRPARLTHGAPILKGRASPKIIKFAFKDYVVDHASKKSRDMQPLQNLAMMGTATKSQISIRFIMHKQAATVFNFKRKTKFFMTVVLYNWLKCENWKKIFRISDDFTCDLSDLQQGHDLTLILTTEASRFACDLHIGDLFPRPLKK